MHSTCTANKLARRRHFLETVVEIAIRHDKLKQICYVLNDLLISNRSKLYKYNTNKHNQFPKWRLEKDE